MTTHFHIYDHPTKYYQIITQTMHDGKVKISTLSGGKFNAHSRTDTSILEAEEADKLIARLHKRRLSHGYTPKTLH